VRRPHDDSKTSRLPTPTVVQGPTRVVLSLNRSSPLVECQNNLKRIVDLRLKVLLNLANERVEMLFVDRTNQLAKDDPFIIQICAGARYNDVAWQKSSTDS